MPNRWEQIITSLYGQRFGFNHEGDLVVDGATVATFKRDTAGRIVGLLNTDGTSIILPRLLAQCAVPFILGCGSGGTGAQPVMGNNGALSAFATQPVGANAGGAWVYFPANAIDGSNVAGWYWSVFSSTTEATVYNNRYTSGDPVAAIPASPTPFVSTGPGAFTQTTAASIDGPVIEVPGGSLGANGALKFTAEFAMSAAAVDRVWGFDMATTAMAGATIASGASTTAGQRWHGTVRNRNSESRQVASGFAGYSNSSSAGVTYYGSVNTGADTTVDFYLRLGASVANAFLCLDAFDIITQYCP